MTIGERIKLFRKEKHLTQQELADLIEVTKSRISEYEKDRGITERSLRAICRIGNLNYSWLVDGVEPMYNSYNDDVIGELANQYNLDDTEKRLLRRYLKMDELKRKEFIVFMKNIFTDEKKEDE